MSPGKRFRWAKLGKKYRRNKIFLHRGEKIKILKNARTANVPRRPYSIRMAAEMLKRRNILINRAWTRRVMPRSFRATLLQTSRKGFGVARQPRPQYDFMQHASAERAHLSHLGRSESWRKRYPRVSTFDGKLHDSANTIKNFLGSVVRNKAVRAAGTAARKYVAYKVAAKAGIPSELAAKIASYL